MTTMCSLCGVTALKFHRSANGTQYVFCTHCDSSRCGSGAGMPCKICDGGHFNSYDGVGDKGPRPPEPPRGLWPRR